LLGSGAAFIIDTPYRTIFGGPMPETNASFLSNAEALVNLMSDESVDGVVVAAGQPAPLIANMRLAYQGRPPGSAGEAVEV
jgi:uncharacterized protein